MAVQTPSAAETRSQPSPALHRDFFDKYFLWILGAVVLLAAVLRYKGIYSPILDHPGWRQGDTASIARNFALLQYNILYPQTNYNGPPPNYVELELQIVPFLAAALYKVFGVHEIFGRLISIAFSLGTVAVTGLFARWLFTSSIAGIIAAFFYATFPGSLYYGRTFTPDTTMVFFLTAALYVTTRLIVEDEIFSQRSLARATALLTFAYLAKPVAVAGIVPVIVALWERVRSGRTMRPTAIAVMLVVPLVILYLYDVRVGEHAEWHWASGITKLHVIPSLVAALTHPSAFVEKLQAFRQVLGMLRVTMLGSIGFFLSIASFVALPWVPARSRAMLWGWLAGGLAYTYVVVTVERVDYYMYLLLPLCALVIGGALAAFLERMLRADAAPAARYAIASLVPIVAIASAVDGHAAVRPYYTYNKQAYRNAVLLDRALPKGAIVVIGHYGPDVQYYINRYGWEEDPYLWTPFDEQSAIRKGARYFISIEDNRFRRNLELCAWMSRFPVDANAPGWPVYQTDPARVLPGAQAFWRAFRSAERVGKGRAFLNAHGVCELHLSRHRSIGS
ncbi:MAG: glycosyltransferase family 39 protein [Candidatus Eremiobacteraeota bacterium]|nr:glycosyltransferase family 39 protein [Candidatus Eremiobacteraeota bacterium]